MRPAVQYAVAFAVLLIGAGAWWWSSGPSAPAPVEPLPLRPEGVEPVETPIVGSMTPGEREALLDELETYEADRFGPDEAEDRRRVRERILEARAAPQTP